MSENKLLDNILLAYPCPIDWDNMNGNERERFCKACSSKVYNLSDMSEAEADAFLQNNLENSEICIRFYKRTDGTIKTDNCPRPLRPMRNLVLKAKSLLLLVTTLIFASSQQANSNETKATSSNENVFEVKGIDSTNILGRPAPSAVREATYEVSSDAREFASPELWKKYKHQEDNRQIVLSTLNELSEYYEKQKLYSCQLNVALLKKFVQEKMPGPKVKFDYAKFEELRNKAQTQLINEIESFPINKVDSKCSFKVAQFRHICQVRPCPSYEPSSFPNGMKLWKGFHSGDPILSPTNLDSIIRCLTKLKPLGGYIDDLHEFETIRSISSSPKNQHNKILTAAEQKWSALWELHCWPAPYVAATFIEKKLSNDKCGKFAIMKYRLSEDPYNVVKSRIFTVKFNQDALAILPDDEPVVGEKYILFVREEASLYKFVLSNPGRPQILFTQTLWEDVIQEGKYYKKFRENMPDPFNPMSVIKNSFKQ